MLQQIQNPFFDKNVKIDRLFISIVVMGLLTIGILSYVNLQNKGDEDI